MDQEISDRSEYICSGTGVWRPRPHVAPLPLNFKNFEREICFPELAKIERLSKKLDDFARNMYAATCIHVHF